MIYMIVRCAVRFLSVCHQQRIRSVRAGAAGAIPACRFAFFFYFSIWHLCCGSQCGSWPCSTRHMRNLLLIIALTLRVCMKYRTASIKASHYIWDVLLGNKGLDGCRITKAVVRVLLYWTFYCALSHSLSPCESKKFDQTPSRTIRTVHRHI